MNLDNLHNLPGVLPDHVVRRLAAEGMIRSFREGTRVPGQLSYGLQPCGYDVRLAPELLVLQDRLVVADPKRLRTRHYQRVLPRRDNTLLLPARSFVLGRSLEEFRLPPNVMAIVVPKGTVAMSGVLVQTAVLEPGWCGVVTLGIANMLPVPVVLYPGEGIAQVIFLRTAGIPEKDYEQLGGIYQGQRGITPPRVMYMPPARRAAVQPAQPADEDAGKLMF